MKAITREEKIMSGENLTPITRKEMFLAKLVGKEIETPFPITRMEKIMNGDQLTPITREEMFLAKSTGQDVKTPTPITRREMFLSKIGGGSGSEETKYYTVNFYNGDELLQSVSVPYGGNAIYTGDEPTKEGGYAFTGFVPDGTNITADTDCYAQFRTTAVVSRKIIDRSISGDYVNDRVTSIGRYTFISCSKLTSVDFPAVTNIGDEAFISCYKLTSVDFPAVTSIGGYAFSGCTNLTSVDFPVVTSIGSFAFISCSQLTALILRSENVCTLSATNALNSTPIASGTGYIYVPRALVDSYKEATNWSAYAARFRALEDYTVDGTITGELDESKI